jgi:formylmethanofuran dehydrogenase subunit E
MYCPDNYDAFVAYEERREREHQELLKRLPKCSKCGKPIENDECYEIGDELYCEECIENSKVWTDNYMKE